MATTGRNVIALKCSECKDLHYYYELGKRKGERTKIEVKKFCPKVRKHTVHKEVKL